MTVRGIRELIRTYRDNNQVISRGHGLEELKKESEDWFRVSRAEANELLRALDETPDVFDRSVIPELRQYATQHMMSRGWWDKLVEGALTAVTFTGAAVEAFQAPFKLGTPPAAEAKAIREAAPAPDFGGSAGVVKLTESSLAGLSDGARLLAIEGGIREAVASIDGMAFLRDGAEHTVLIKPGVNWGQFQYPTVSSWESVYAAVKMTLEEGNRHGSTTRVIVGEQSGVECKIWGGSTMGNFEHTGILHGAVLAGLERAAALEASGDANLQGAKTLLDRARASDKITLDDHAMIAMAEAAGVRIVAFEDTPHQRIPVEGARHFRDGILVPKLVVDEVTDIINLPKPPGRHMIMGNTGCTGALKNFVGLLGASDRVPALHGPFDRFPAINDGEQGDTYRDRLRALGDRLREDGLGSVIDDMKRNAKLNWKGHGPGIGFHEKLTELYLAHQDKVRFTVTDMRRTVSSLGPDLGDTIDVGAVIAAKDPVTVDLIGSAMLKQAYDDIGGFGEAARPGGDTVTEYLAGRGWLPGSSDTPFDQYANLAALSYGVGPIDLSHIDLSTSGFAKNEVTGFRRYLDR